MGIIYTYLRNRYNSLPGGIELVPLLLRPVVESVVKHVESVELVEKTADPLFEFIDIPLYSDEDEEDKSR
jgi:hypothetical protein